MNIDQSAAILYALSVANSLVTVGETEIRFWAPKWQHLEFVDAEAAVNGYYGEGGGYQAGRQHIGPADVIGLATLERNRRTKRPDVIASGCYEPDIRERLRLGSGEAHRALAGKLEDDPVREVRIAQGLLAIQPVLDAITARLERQRADAVVEPTRSDLLLAAARRRAAADRRSGCAA